MVLRYLDGEDRLVLWTTDKFSWLDKLSAVEFSDEELAEIERISQAFWDMQKRLKERFGFNRFYT
jgi:hypothetical protein